MKNGVSKLAEVELLSFVTDQKDSRYCPYHRREGHKLQHCVTLRRMLDKKHKAGDILFQEGAVSTNDTSFPSITKKAKVKS